MTLRRREYLVEQAPKETVVELSELPPNLKKALAKLGYRRRDIRVAPATEVDMHVVGGAGSRGIAIVVNVDTGKVSDAVKGSWGGANPFEKKPLDTETKVRIPSNGAIIKGSEGGHGMFLTIYVHPSQLIDMLPGETNLTTREQDILGMARFKSGYKKEMFHKNRVTKEELVSLANRGYIKINKAGATSLTAKGKNAGTKKSFY